MTRDPHCDGCKADDKLRALRRERDELQAEVAELRARLAALGDTTTVSVADVEIVHATFHIPRTSNGAGLSTNGPWPPVSPETTP